MRVTHTPALLRRCRSAKTFGVLAASLLASAFAGGQVLESGMGNTIYCNTLNGDFATAGTSTRTNEYDGAQTPVFNLAVNSLPNGANVVAAFANWSYLGNNPQNINNVLVNGKAVQGNLSGRGERDLFWGFEYGFAYTADVTAIFKANGNYQITGATDNLGAQRIGEGFSVVMVYELANAPQREVNVYDGYTSTTTSDATATLNFCNAYQNGPLHFYTNALDGQEMFTNDLFIEGQQASGQLGTGVAPHAWKGVLGPGAVGHNFYDHAEGDASGFVNAGAVSLTYQTYGFDDPGSAAYTDAVGHTFAGTSFEVVPEPGQLLVLGAGLAALGRKRMRSKI